MPASLPALLPRLGPPLLLAILAGPVLAGLAGTMLPAFGYLPALGGDTLSLEAFRTLAGEPGIARSMLLSFATGLGATAMSTMSVMLFLAGAAPATLRRVQAVLSPLLAVPHAAAAFGLAFLIAPSGLIARLISPGLTGWDRPPDLALVNDPFGVAMTLGLAAKEIPFLFLIALAALPQIPLREARQLAASCGHGRIAGFLALAWPPLYRQMRLAVFAVLAFSTSVIDVALILGPQTPSPLAIRLLGWMNDADLSMRFVAAAGAVAQLGVTLAALAVWLGIEKAGAALLALVREHGLRLRRDRAVRALVAATTALSALLIGGGLIVLALWSVAGFWAFPDASPDTMTLAGWRTVVPRLGAPLATTLDVGIGASAIATLLAVLCLMREDETGRNTTWIGRHSRGLIYLPLIVPQAAFLFGLQILAIVTGIDGTFPALMIAHLTFVAPYVFLSLSDPWRVLDRRTDMAAASLGAGPWRRLFSVRLPLLSRALATALALGFAVSVAQYLATVTAGAGRLTTITTETVALASGGNRRTIGIHVLIQTALPAIGFAIATLGPALLWRSRRGLRAGWEQA